MFYGHFCWIQSELNKDASVVGYKTRPTWLATFEHNKTDQWVVWWHSVTLCVVLLPLSLCCRNLSKTFQAWCLFVVHFYLFVSDIYTHKDQKTSITNLFLLLCHVIDLLKANENSLNNPNTLDIHSGYGQVGPKPYWGYYIS